MLKEVGKIKTISKDMFENIYGCPDPKNPKTNLIATGHHIGDSHYVVILQGSKGELIDLEVTDLTKELF